MTEIGTLAPSAADPAVERLALLLHDSFVAYHDAYLEVTHRAASRFLNREWDEHLDDNTERLGLHKKGVWSAVDAARLIVSTDPDTARQQWIEARRRYVALVGGRMDFELAETFYNSVTRRLFEVIGLDIGLEFLWLGPTALPADDGTRGEYRNFPVDESLAEAFRQILEHSPLASQFADIERDVERVTADVQRVLDELEQRRVQGGQLPRARARIVGRDAGGVELAVGVRESHGVGGLDGGARFEHAPTHALAHEARIAAGGRDVALGAVEEQAQAATAAVHRALGVARVVGTAEVVGGAEARGVHGEAEHRRERAPIGVIHAHHARQGIGWTVGSLAALRAHVAAGLRETNDGTDRGRANRQLASRLPAWMLSAKHRAQVQSAIARLEERLDERR